MRGAQNSVARTFAVVADGRIVRCNLRSIVCLAAVAMTSCLAGCNQPREGRSARDETIARDAGAMQGFAHLVSGEWTTTLTNGTVLRETWRWEPDGESLRVVGQGGSVEGRPWHEEARYFRDPASGGVRVRGRNSYRNGAFEGTVAFGDRTAEARFVITQDGATRRLVRRWRFDGEDRFETELLEIPHGEVEVGEVHFGEELVPLASWTYARTRKSPASTPNE